MFPSRPPSPLTPKRSLSSLLRDDGPWTRPFLGNATDPPLVEHATDIHGVTLSNFVVRFGGKVLSPPIRDLDKITLFRDETPAEAVRRYPHAGLLLGARWNEDLIAGCRPDLHHRGINRRPAAV